MAGDVGKSDKGRHLFQFRSKVDLGSFQFSSPRKYSFVHVYWPKKAKNNPNKHFDWGVGAVAPILKRIHNSDK